MRTVSTPRLFRLGGTIVLLIVVVAAVLMGPGAAPSSAAQQDPLNMRQRIVVNGNQMFERSCVEDFSRCDDFKMASHLVPGVNGDITGMSTFVKADDTLVEIVVRGGDIYYRESVVNTAPPPWGEPIGSVATLLPGGANGADLNWLTTVAVNNGPTDQTMLQAYGFTDGNVYLRQDLSGHNLGAFAVGDSWPVSDHVSEIIRDAEGGYGSLVAAGLLTDQANIISANWGGNEGDGVHFQSTWFADPNDGNRAKGFWRGTRFENGAFSPAPDDAGQWQGPMYLNVLDGGVPVSVTELNAQAAYIIPENRLADRTKFTVIGESYAAGVGIDASNDSYCVRHAESYGPIVAHEKNYDLDLLACSGARITELLGDTAFLEGRNDQLAELDPTSDVIAISMGGNDVPSLKAYLMCVGFLGLEAENCQSAAQVYIEQELRELADLHNIGDAGLLLRLYQHVDALAPNAEIHVLGYPDVLNAWGQDCVLGDGVVISEGAANWADGWTADLNHRIQQVINHLKTRRLDPITNIRYVGTSSDFHQAGGGLCQANPAINPVIALADDAPDDSPPVDRSSFHPNRAGYQAYANALLRSLNGGQVQAAGMGDPTVDIATTLVRALEGYASSNGHYTVRGGGWKGGGQGWFNSDAGNYRKPIRAVLMDGGWLAKTAPTRNPINNTDFLVYRCANRIAVFAKTISTTTPSHAARWWTDNGCTTYPQSKQYNHMTLSRPLCDRQVATVDLLLGESPTTGDDVIMGTDAADTIRANFGDDVICAGAGDDFIAGNQGNDRIFGGPGNDTLHGGYNDDVVYGEAGNDTIVNNRGNDVMHGGPGNDTITGGIHNDELRGDNGNDVLNGRGGNDTAWGGWGADRLYGGDGNDTLGGNQGDDRIWGGAGNDVLYGGYDNDLVYGGAGNDTLANNRGNDTMDGGAGTDTCRRGNGTDTLISC